MADWCAQTHARNNYNWFCVLFIHASNAFCVDTWFECVRVRACNENSLHRYEGARRADHARITSDL